MFTHPSGPRPDSPPDVWWRSFLSLHLCSCASIETGCWQAGPPMFTTGPFSSKRGENSHELGSRRGPFFLWGAVTSSRTGPQRTEITQQRESSTLLWSSNTVHLRSWMALLRYRRHLVLRCLTSISRINYLTSIMESSLREIVPQSCRDSVSLAMQHKAHRMKCCANKNILYGISSKEYPIHLNSQLVLSMCTLTTHFTCNITTQPHRARGSDNFISRLPIRGCPESSVSTASGLTDTSAVKLGLEELAASHRPTLAYLFFSHVVVLGETEMARLNQEECKWYITISKNHMFLCFKRNFY